MVLRCGGFQFASLGIRLRHLEAAAGVVTTFGMTGIAVDYQEDIIGDVKAHVTIGSVCVSEVLAFCDVLVAAPGA